MATHFHGLIASMLLGSFLLSPGYSQVAPPFDSARATPQTAAQLSVGESARQIPVAYDVDVVVVGGSSAAVAAAVTAARHGARVFLAAPRPYLGEDICATYRLWLEPNEKPTSPLAQSMFAEPEVARHGRNALPFTYETDVESSSRHRDSTPPSVLNDGKWHSAPSQSVQYDGDVTITADLGSSQDLRRVHVLAYQRNGDFEVDRITVQVSNNKQAWRRVATIKNGKLGQGSFEESAIRLSAWLNNPARYVRFVVRKSPNASRALLGEIVIEKPAGPPSATPHRAPPRPMQVKRALDDALLDAGVSFLYGCYPTDVLRDEDGAPAGIVMANRSGRQAIKAKVIVDATARATVARLSGVRFAPYPAGLRTFRRIVVGGPIREGEQMQARKMPTPVYAPDGRTHEAIEYTLQIPMADGSFSSFAHAEQVARDKTWHAKQVDASEVLFEIPPDRMAGQGQQDSEWPGADKVALEAFRPANIERLFVLGGCADVSQQVAERLLRPLEFMRVGERIGAAAAAEAETVTLADPVRLTGVAAATYPSGEVREDTGWMRAGAGQGATVDATERALPILAEYDVVVVGGGTAGAPAGIAAGRQGAETLVVEYLHGLGGVGTMGLIGKYYYGYREGFTKEIDRGLAELGGASEGGSGQGQAWNSQLKIEWYRQQLRRAGADLWYGTLGCGAFVDGGQVKGAVVASDAGRGVILAKTVIDSTGSATIAAAAGAECIYTSGEHIAVQGTGLPYWGLGARYTNTDYTFIDDIDIVDAWRSFLVGRKKFKDRYDLGQLIDTRERRQVVGDFFLSPIDAYLGRTFPDTVVQAHSNFDTHGFTIHPMFMLKPPDREVVPTYVPYRSLLPKGLEGIFVTGLGVSAHRDVMPVIRMQPDVQNQAYAVGVAGAWAAAANKALRDIDIRALQRHLVEKGILKAEVLTHKDSFPLPEEDIQCAVQDVVEDFKGVEILFAQQDSARPLLRQAYQHANSPQDKLTYAHILGIMGDPTGAATLAEAVRAEQWDEGWNYTGMGQYGRSISPVDSLIIALGRTRRPEALAPILEMVEELGPEHAMSHHRAVSIALESLRDPRAAQPLADLLQKPGMAGHAYTDIKDVTTNIPASPVDTSTREQSLRELILARALYRCGDHKGLGEKTLNEYARDLRGHYARHALAILQEKPGQN
ncbi:MAG: FAD-dependent oxidoreductase [Phycisphaerales bacterium]|nr:MAG: FAD-dependent oxidoreductase [Phycisphaerales bacterium]